MPTSPPILTLEQIEEIEARLGRGVELDQWAEVKQEKESK